MQDINYQAKSVLPTGVCCVYGAPEHLRSVQLQRQGERDREGALINGPAADMWSFGAVVYEMVSCCSSTGIKHGSTFTGLQLADPVAQMVMALML